MVEPTLKLSNSQGALCKVCGDRASGKHYGVPSCDGCRGFFKRSIRRNLEYVCKEGGKCIVDVSRRNQCQACRFAKCIQANMRREAVQHERAPRNCAPLSVINGLNPSDFYASRSFPMPQTNLFFPLPLHITTGPGSASASAFTPLDPTRFMPNYGVFDHFPPTVPFGTSTMPTLPPPKPTLVDKSMSESIFNKIAGDTTPPHPPTAGATGTGHSINSILNFSATAAAAVVAAKENEVSSSEDPRPSTTSTVSGSDESTASNELKTETEILFETAAKLLFLAVKWAKSVPSFLQLPTADQKILLEESWAELFVITAAQWGLPIDCDFIARNPSAKKLHAIIQQFTLARVDYREAACLKALILFRSDHASLFSGHEILLLQDQTISLLHEKCGGVRLGHLLLLLPGIKAAANGKVLQEMLFRKTIGEVAIERLLVDLMKT